MLRENVKEEEFNQNVDSAQYEHDTDQDDDPSEDFDDNDEYDNDIKRLMI